DVAGFLTLGDVFTSAMNGNTALLAIALSQGRILSATQSFSALVGLTLGASLATAIYILTTKAAKFSGIRPLLLVEISCLGIFAMILTFVARPVESVGVYGLVVLSALAMGIQGVCARQIKSPGINTIVCTTTLNIIV